MEMFLLYFMSYFMAVVNFLAGYGLIKESKTVGQSLAGYGMLFLCISLVVMTTISIFVGA